MKRKAKTKSGRFKALYGHWLGSKNAGQWIAIIVLFALSIYSMQINAGFLKTSLLSTKEHAAFDGTVFPIQQVPDWTHAASTDLTKNFHDFPSSQLISIPSYNLDYITFPSANLVWGKSEHDVIRNTKITYPVPYAGNYELNDGGEGVGSHPAVDIKALEGTPVYAIANGIVVKNSAQSGGFGTLIVLEHHDVPNPNNPSQTTNLHSGYAHLSKSFVADGDIVRKGQIIGEVGRTGTATTNHLHFQLDAESAPWHLYWPFTSTEASNAGYSFWEAINEGLGKDNVYRYTYNPMRWVQAHLNGTVTTTSTSPTLEDPVETIEDTTVETPVETSVETPVESPVESSVVRVDFSSIKLEGSDFILAGNNGNYSVQLLDENGSVVASPSFDGQINVSATDSGVAQINKAFLNINDFSNGEAQLRLYGQREGSFRVQFEIAGTRFSSQNIQVLSQVQPFARFGVEHDGVFSPAKPELITIQALDAEGNPTPSFNAGGTIEMSTVQGEGSFSPSTLTSEDFVNGKAIVTFTGANDEDVVILALYGRARAESDLLQAKLFSDLSSAHEYYPAVSFLFKNGTVQGYPDGSFKPSQTVSRVEALKFIFAGMDKTLLANARLNFSDAYNGEWYTPYVATAQNLGIVSGYPDGSFKPAQGVNRVEFLKMLLNTADVSVDPVVIDAPYEDVDTLSWYAPYVQYAKQKNLFPEESNLFNGNKYMDRSEVAEVIYRWIVVQQNGVDVYDSSLVATVADES